MCVYCAYSIYTVYTLMSLKLEFILSQTDGRPMYLQIMEQIKNQVTLGDWPQGFKLPSIREMAVATRVSVITVKRAYQELESEGVIVTQHGKGSFISEIDNLSAQIKEQEMDKYLNQAIAIARSIGMSVEQLQTRLTELQKPNGQQKTNLSEKSND
jgi:GntR family transcriptional regulator